MKNNELMTPVPINKYADEWVAHYMFHGKGRLILTTIHGEIIIDIRNADVNSYVFENGKRVDRVLLNTQIKWHELGDNEMKNEATEDKPATEASGQFDRLVMHHPNDPTQHILTKLIAGFEESHWYSYGKSVGFARAQEETKEELENFKLSQAMIYDRMIEPSDNERASLPETTQQYIAMLEELLSA